MKPSDSIWLKPKDILVFFVNGKKVIEEHADPEVSLLTYLRSKLRLTGTKLGCGEGGCGACTVMVSKWDSAKRKVVHYSLNSCLAPVVSMHECAITTVEGIGSTKTKLHAVQERLAKFHGSQCGFCTPGIIMSMYALLRNKPVPTSENIEMCLQGNLCRCTGYRPIISAFKTFTNQNSGCPLGKECCCKQKETASDPSKAAENGVDVYISASSNVCFNQYDPTQEPIFPPELAVKVQKHRTNEVLKFSGERVTWYRPVTLDQLSRLKEKFPDAHLVVGNTEIGIETWVKGQHFPIIVTPAGVDELTKISVDDDGLTIGASCTLTQMRKEFLKIKKEKGEQLTQPLTSILEMLYWFAGDQIRNVGVLGGNIMTASPISDLNPIFMACESEATFVLHSRGERTIPMDQSFFPSYRKTAALKEEVLTQIRLPFTGDDEYMKAYMQSKRREDDIAIVNAAMKVQFYSTTKRVKKFTAAFGGMAATSIMPNITMKKMCNREWDQKLLDDALLWLCEDLPLSLDAPGGMVEYREALAASFFFKFFIYVKDCLVKKGVVQESITEVERSTMVPTGGDHHQFQATQTWQEVPQGQSVDDLVGRSTQHLSADKQVTGEAVYIDDMPPYADELYLALVTSIKSHAHILDVDIGLAKECPGFVAWVDHGDVPGINDLTTYGDVFADGKVTCIGHVIGAVVANTHAHAQRAARLVKVTYEDIEPAIVTIEDAIKHQSFYEPILKIVCGNSEEMMEKCDHVIEGEFRMSGQEHFYLETQACLAVPKGEDGEMEIFASSQNPSMLQSDAALVLGVDANKINVRVKRMGGGFGGKETRFHVLANPVAVAAHKCGKPVRCMLTRQEDMLITGGRHPFLTKYKVGFSKTGEIISLTNKLYINAGNTVDLSIAVMENAMLHSDNCYKIPNMTLQGFLCRTNITSNTAFRGFGGIQGSMIAEQWINKVAHFLNLSTEEVRQKNLYKENDVTHYSQKIENFQGMRCWQECLRRSDFEKRRKEVEHYNVKNRWRKRGISCVPLQFGIAFSQKILNQAGALVHIYKDGSVLLTHGGTEMGQGLHTKMAQVASRCLGVPISRVYISETSTNTVPNTSPTAASASSDLNGMAVKLACDQIAARLSALKEENPKLSWNEIIMKAYTNRIGLSACGFYAPTNVGLVLDPVTGKTEGNPFRYYTYGAGVSEVEIDCLSGDHILLRTDIVMDLGKSLNPSVDIGQIEGGFTQGYGLFTIEEPLHSPKGNLLTRGPGTYKIPGFGDCPHQFNVHLLRDSVNERAIFSSKAVGEPPLFLGASVFFAIKNAIGFARKDSGKIGYFRLDSPATSERIRMACGDKFTEQHSRHSTKEQDSLKIPWSLQA